LTRTRDLGEPAGMFGRKRKPSRDFFQRSVEDRRATEDEQPWFLAPDDGPALEVDAGRSARMDDEDEGGRRR
jgi:hypothetical protein